MPKNNIVLFKSVNELHKELTRFLSSESVRCIGIDGKDGAGKTSLGRQITDSFSGTLVSFDDYLDENKGGYVPNMRIEEIKNKIINSSPPIVMEGVCLLAIAELIGIDIDALIYVKKINSHGFWADEEECIPTIPAEELILRKEKELREFSEIEKIIEGEHSTCVENKVELPELEKEIIRYHAKYKPIVHAQYTLEIIDA